MHVLSRFMFIISLDDILCVLDDAGHVDSNHLKLSSLRKIINNFIFVLFYRISRFKEKCL